jgi:hypothetical protein
MRCYACCQQILPPYSVKEKKNDIGCYCWPQRGTAISAQQAQSEFVDTVFREFSNIIGSWYGLVFVEKAFWWKQNIFMSKQG